jgi:hypothetical protein
MTKGKFNYHWDNVGHQWNVFNPEGEYVCSFVLAIDAEAFCDSANEELDA